MHKPPIISLIAAVAENGAIGIGNRLPWHLPADLRHFKQLTINKPILMGRKTWESLPGLLPQRTHIVITRDPAYRAEDCVLVHSAEQAIAAAGDVPEIMVVGGAAIYADLLPLAQRMYLTRLHLSVDGDARFPAWSPEEWKEVSREDHGPDERNPLSYSFLQLERV